MSKKKRDYFMFRREYYDAIKYLPDAMAGRIYSAIADFMLDDIEHDFVDGVEKTIWILLKPMLIRDLKKMDSENLWVPKRLK